MWTGPVTNNILGKCSRLSSALTKMTNISLKDKHLMKKSHKDPEQLKNCRSIRNLPTLSKNVQKLASIQITNYIQIKGLDEDSTHTFKKRRCYDYRRRKAVILVLLDSSTAFDTGGHDDLCLVYLSKKYCLNSCSCFFGWLKCRSWDLYCLFTQPYQLPDYHTDIEHRYTGTRIIRNCMQLVSS